MDSNLTEIRVNVFETGVKESSIKRPIPDQILLLGPPPSLPFKVDPFYFLQDLYLLPLPTFYYTYMDYGDLTSEFLLTLPCKI